MVHMKIRELLLHNISENKFFDICNFVEELYLMDYDILILMARKFFNLFCVFHEINCEKYRKLNIPYENHGRIITNRAIPLIKYNLQNNKYKKVVVADDIIIHGRSIREVYDDLLALCPKLEVLLVSYVRNDHETSAYMDISERIYSRYLLDVHEWRELSDEVVSIFYMSGRPYISYLPYFLLNVDWENLKNKLHKEDCLSIANGDMRRFEIRAFMYAGNEIEIFQKLRCCQICAIRFYHYPKIEKVVAVPYFCMHIMDEDSVQNLSEFIRQKYFKADYLELLKNNNGADEMRIIELEYTFSAWMCMYLFNLIGISSVWKRDIEEYTFLERFLSNETLTNQEIQNRLDAIGCVISRLKVRDPYVNDDIKFLLEKCDELKKVYKKNYCRWNKLNQWEDGMMSYLQRFIDNYLAINGNLDEERCSEQYIDKKRLFGAPVSYLLNDITNFLCELDQGKRTKSYYIKLVFAAILTSIDSGRGTIVNKVATQHATQKYIESVIYAGEQNYKFYDNTNFPIMYGLYLIEQETKQRNIFSKTKKYKEIMVKQFSDYLEQKQIFYIKEELLQISSWNISENYGKFLQNSYEKYYGNPILSEAVNMALNICNRTCE